MNRGAIVTIDVDDRRLGFSDTKVVDLGLLRSNAVEQKESEFYQVVSGKGEQVNALRMIRTKSRHVLTP